MSGSLLILSAVCFFCLITGLVLHLNIREGHEKFRRAEERCTYYVCAHPLENEGRKGGGQIKDLIRHLPQNIPVHWWFCLLCHCLLANIIYEGSRLLPEKKSRQQIPVTGSFQRAELLARWVQGAYGQLTLVIQIYVQVRFVNLINGFSLCGLHYWSSFLTYLQINITYNNVSLKYVVCMFSH